MAHDIDKYIIGPRRGAIHIATSEIWKAAGSGLPSWRTTGKLAPGVEGHPDRLRAGLTVTREECTD
jgi:hypothetical protein